MKLTQVAIGAVLAATLSPSDVHVHAAVDLATAPNVIIMQPDDLEFFEAWTPPAHMGSESGWEYPSANDVTDTTLSTLPNMNRLRTDGLQMMRAYAASAKCGTSRYATMTSRYASRSSFSRDHDMNADGAEVSNVVIPTTKLQDEAPAGGDGNDCSENNLAALFKSAGYATGVVGKWHLTKTKGSWDYDKVQEEIQACGFDYAEAIFKENLDETEDEGFHHNMEYMTSRAITFIEDAYVTGVEDRVPFFLYANPTVPHTPDILDALNYDCTATPEGTLTDVDDPIYSISGMTGDYDGSCADYRQSVMDRAGSETNNDLGSVWVDDAIGAILTALDAKGELENTIFIFQQDHGQEAKDSIWESGIRIAQFVHFPASIAAGSTFDGTVSTVDLGPTLAAYAGIESHYDMDGRSWKDAVDGGTGTEWTITDDDDDDEKCVYGEMDLDRSLVCGCDKYMRINDIDDDTKGTAENAAKAANNLPTLAADMLFDLCGGTGTYVTTPGTNPEEEDQFESRPVRAAQLSALMDCYLQNTIPGNVPPVYTACTMDAQTPTVAPDPPTPEPTPSPTETDEDGPELLALSPQAGEHIGSVSSYTFAAQIDDASALERVEFRFRLEDADDDLFEINNNAMTYENGMWTVEDDADVTALLTDYEGTLEWMVFARDVFGNMLRGDYEKFFVGDAASTVVAAVRHQIEDIIETNLAADPQVNMAAKFIRMGFHDCVGGCDGCIDMTNGDNAGLDVPIAALESVVAAYENDDVSRADIWAIATLVGADVSLPAASQGRFPLEYIGRVNCEDANAAAECVNAVCSSTSGPDRELPSGDLTTHELLDYFDAEFGFTDQETVALMGAHSLGGMSRYNSGFGTADGSSWVTNPTSLGVQYYEDLVGGDDAANDSDAVMIDATDWTAEALDNTDFGTSNRNQWSHTRSNGIVTKMTNTDIALVRDLSGATNADGIDYLDADGLAACQFKCNRNCDRQDPVCPMANATIQQMSLYKNDADLFYDDFEAVMGKMTIAGYDAPAACADAVCVLDVEATGRKLIRGGEQ